MATWLRLGSSGPGRCFHKPDTGQAHQAKACKTHGHFSCPRQNWQPGSPMHCLTFPRAKGKNC